MKKSITTPSTNQSIPDQPAAPPPAQAADGSENTERAEVADISWIELHAIVALLPAYLAANSDAQLIESVALPPWIDPFEETLPVRVCFRLNSAFFHMDTPLDEMLIALMRESRRGISSGRLSLIVTTELTHNMGASLRATWSSLVVTARVGAQRDECVASVNALMRFLTQAQEHPTVDGRRVRNLRQDTAPVIFTSGCH